MRSLSTSAKCQLGCRVGKRMESAEKNGIPSADGEDRHQAVAENGVGSSVREPCLRAGLVLFFVTGIEGMNGEAADLAADTAEIHLPAIGGEGIQQKATAEKCRVAPQVAFVRVTGGQFLEWESLDRVAFPAIRLSQQEPRQRESDVGGFRCAAQLRKRLRFQFGRLRPVEGVGLGCKGRAAYEIGTGAAEECGSAYSGEAGDAAQRIGVFRAKGKCADDRMGRERFECATDHGCGGIFE